MDTTKTESSVDHKDKRVKHSKNHQLKKNIIHLANELLDICRSKPYSDSSKVLKNKPLINSIPERIRSLRQLKSNVFIYFYEIICDAELVDKKWPAVSIDDEVHNIQAVIDSLSLDILHEDLSYLTGESILGLNSVNNKPDLTSIEYLLDILRCVHEWISSRIETTTDVTKTVTEITPNPEPPTQHVQETADYADLNEKIHQTLQMTKNSLFNQTNQEREEDDVFKSYMRQKEQEYKLTKSNSVDNSADNSRPLSAIETNDEIIELVNQTSQTNEMKPNVKPYLETIDNELALIRKNLEHNLYLNDKNVNQFLEQVYNQDLEDAKTLQQAELNRVMKKCQLTNELYESAYVNGPSVRVENPPLPFKPNLKVSRSSRSKGVLLPRNKSLTNYALAKRRSSSMSQLEKTQRLTRRAQSASTGASANPRKQFLSRFLITEEGILNCLLQEFPYLYTSPETIHYLWQRHSKQIQTMTKNYKEFKDNFFRTEQSIAESENEDTSQYSNTVGKNKVREHLKETYRKQKMLMDLMRDDLEHTQRLQDSKRKQLLENSMKAKMREDRFRSAKVKRYMDEFRLQQRARMLKQSTSEELIFKRLFNESIKLQKERMLELKKYAKEKNDIYMKKQLNQIESIENMYKNKFNLLNEKFINEKNEALNREKAQHLILSKMNKNVKTKLESDIRDLQDQLYRDKDFLHWRQLDADKIKNQLVKANYVTLNK